MRSIMAALSAFLVFISASAGVSAADPLGVVLMHGKRGTDNAGSPVGVLAEALREAGFKTVVPEMPWSRDRFLDRDFEGILAEIDAAVKQLEKAGAKKIVVGGHSLGANAALAFGARRDGLAGVLVIAPGHVPEAKGFRERFGADVAKAKAMIAAGKGNEKADFGDRNQGDTDTFSVAAKNYADFMDPEGPMVMPRNAAKLKGAPLMVIIGEKDSAFRFGRGGRDDIFDKAPAHPKSVYKVVRGGHKATPRIGKAAIIDWLKSL